MVPNVRKTFILILGIAVAGLLLFGLIRGQHPSAQCPDCNVILISLDSVRQDHLPLYGYMRDTSPNLTKWAKGAFIFDNYFVTSYLTPISEMSVQTGLYPTTNGVIGFDAPLSSKTKTLAEILKSRGWQTAAIGSSPEFYSTASGGTSEAMRNNFRRGFDHYFDAYYKNPAETELYPPFGEEPSEWKDYSWPNYYRGLPFGAIDWIRQNRDKRFFLWIPIGTAHWPYNIGRPYQFTDRNYAGWLKSHGLYWLGDASLREIYQNQRWQNGNSTPISAEDKQFIIDRYDDGIYLTDKFLGEVFRAIDDAGLNKKTIVIVESEHGEELGERGYFAHYDIFDQETHVPLMIKIPGFSGGLISEMISAIDIMPTLIEILGISNPSNIDGKSFFAYLNKNLVLEPFRKYVFVERTPLWEHVIEAMSEKSPQFKWLDDFFRLDAENHFRDLAIRTKDWKLIYRESREIQKDYSWWGRLTGQTINIPEFELYDLKHDPGETKNVIDQYPEIAQALQSELQSWKLDLDARAPIRPPSTKKLQPYF